MFSSSLSSLHTVIRTVSRLPVKPLFASKTCAAVPIACALSRATYSTKAPIELFSSATPNGDKVHIMLEEARIPYIPKIININQGEQLTPEFIAINPNNRIPAIIDPEGDDGKPLRVFESGAILIYLAEKHGKFLPTHPGRRAETMSWLMWQMGGVGPMFGQLGHFLRHKEHIAYPIMRYTEESKRLLRILDRHLANNQWVAAGEYTIADMAIYPWVKALFERGILQGEEGFSHVKRYIEVIDARPAVERAYKVCRITNPDEKRNFFTFSKPEGFEHVNIYDIKGQAERKLH
eukprot:comp17556_c0_seq1/m.17155 comp17556_c0_seq1/g.17155  ORF comp17556_c0_seq1/g.17155 comp17556_c0_seq1/m.17155 type:complete len:292 (-) comp17556_c0_seq1:190-1065(-)